MDDESITGELVDARLKAAARSALAVPRRRLLLPTPGEHGGLQDRGRRRRVIAFVAVNAVMVAAGFGAAFGVLALSRGQSTPPPAASSVPSPSPTLKVGAVIPLPTVAVDGDPAEDLGALAVGDGSIWVAASGEGAVVRIDRQSGRTVATIPVGAGRSPAAADRLRRYPTAVTVAPDGSVWATANAEKAIVRIDPSTNRVAETIALGVEPTSLAVDASTAWVEADGDRALLSVDIMQRRVTHRMAIARASSISIAAGAVWVVAKGDGNIIRIDETSGVVVTAITSPTSADWTWITVGSGPAGVWAVDQSDSWVAQIDTSSSTAARRVSVMTGPRSIAVGSGVVWVATAGWLQRIDASTSALTSSLVPGIASLVADGDGVWALLGDPGGSTRLLHVVGISR